GPPICVPRRSRLATVQVICPGLLPSRSPGSVRVKHTQRLLPAKSPIDWWPAKRLIFFGTVWCNDGQASLGTVGPNRRIIQRAVPVGGRPISIPELRRPRHLFGASKSRRLAP